MGWKHQLEIWMMPLDKNCRLGFVIYDSYRNKHEHAASRIQSNRADEYTKYGCLCFLF